MDYPHLTTSRGANVRVVDDDDDDGERIDDGAAVPSVVKRRARRGATSFGSKCLIELKRVVWSWSTTPHRHHGARVAVRRTRTREQGPG